MSTGLYVHVPFCARACPYCDFDFEVGAPDLRAYFVALRRDLERAGALAPRTVYLGGGTPSRLGPDGLRELGGLLRGSVDFGGVVEFTIEVNPEDVDDALLRAATDVGIDRVSAGVQSFDTGGLVTLGRGHRPPIARRALEQVAAAGLRTSADLIVGWPGQSARMVQADVEQALAYGVEHVSVYALTIEEGSAWPGLVRRGQRRMPDEDEQADALLASERALEAAGFEHYEVASYAKDGAESAHNNLYWTWRDYVGVGPSAASATFDPDGTVTRRTNARGLRAWSGGAAPSVETLTAAAAAAEALWTGLRRLAGVPVADLLLRFPAIDRDWIQDRVAPQVAIGNLAWSSDRERIRVAPERWLWHDEIAAMVLDW